MKTNLTHLTDEGLEVDYTLWEDKGDYYQPPHHEVEITKIVFEGVDVTELMFNVAEQHISQLEESLNKYNN